MACAKKIVIETLDQNCISSSFCVVAVGFIVSTFTGWCYSQLCTSAFTLTLYGTLYVFNLLTETVYCELLAYNIYCI